MNNGEQSDRHRDANTAFVQRITNVTVAVWIMFLPLVIFQFLLTSYIEGRNPELKAANVFAPL